MTFDYRKQQCSSELANDTQWHAAVQDSDSLEHPLRSIIEWNTPYSRTDNNWCPAGKQQHEENIEVTRGFYPAEIILQA